MNRTILLAAALVVVAAIGAAILWKLRSQPELLEDRLWQAYAGKFVTPEGRVIDPENDGISHSEGQGYGMLLAEAAHDRARFDAIWRWTRAHLQREDGLFAWRYGKLQDGSGGVTDDNDASDGDILIAWALLRAAEDWRDSDARSAARAIVAALKEKMIVSIAGRMLLLPGGRGFVEGTRVVVNPSYLIFPAFRAFARAFPDPLWNELDQSGLRLLADARFGKFGLPPDWLAVDPSTLAPASNFPPRYGFDAVRIPLYLAWAGAATEQRMAPFRAFWRQDPVPAWIDLKSGETAPYAWLPAMRTLAALSSGAAAADLALPAADDGYYGSSLMLLARIAARERPR